MQAPIALKLHNLCFWVCLIAAHPAKTANTIMIVRADGTSQHRAVRPVMDHMRMPGYPALSLPTIPMLRCLLHRSTNMPPKTLPPEPLPPNPVPWT